MAGVKPGQLDPAAAALYALVALALILTGSMLVTSALTIEQRATLLASCVAVLAAVAWRGRRDRE